MILDPLESPHREAEGVKRVDYAFYASAAGWLPKGVRRRVQPRKTATARAIQTLDDGQR